MSWYQLLMIWLDFSVIVGVGIIAIFGAEGIIALQQFLIDRLKP